MFERNLVKLLANLKPALSDEEYVFYFSPSKSLSYFMELDPICFFKEEEGVTLIIEKHIATKNNLAYEGVFRKITLQVHSSLEAVGLTAAVSDALAKNDISSNVVAAFYHDHIFVPSKKAKAAIKVLKMLES